MSIVELISKYIVGKFYPYWSGLFFLTHSNRKESVMYPNCLLVKKIFINPNKITFFTSLPVKPKKGSAYFLDGDWDKCLPKIDIEMVKNYKYKTADEIIKRNTPLIETPEYKHVENLIKIKGSYRGFINSLDYMKSIKSLYDSISLKGYLERNSFFNPWIGEVEVALGRDGRLIKMNSGNHRFACSRILSLKRIPVNVCMIHDDYYSEFEKGGFRAINKLLYDIEIKYR
jgi:hypothetical protein